MHDQYQSYSNDDLLYISAHPEEYSAVDISYARQILEERGIAVPNPEVVMKRGGLDQDLATNPYGKISWDFEGEDGVLNVTQEVDPKALRLHKVLCLYMVILTAALLLMNMSAAILLYGICVYMMYKLKPSGWHLLQYLAISNIVAALIDISFMAYTGGWDFLWEPIQMFRILLGVLFAIVLAVIHKDNMLYLFSISPSSRRKSLISAIAIIAVMRIFFYIRYQS